MSAAESAPPARQQPSGQAQRPVLVPPASGQSARPTLDPLSRQPGTARSAAPIRPVLVRPTPFTARAAGSLRLPAFWLIAALLVGGAVRTGDLLSDAFRRFPVATAVAVLLFTLYVVPFWGLVSTLDYLEREPPPLLATAFGWGALVATAAAIPGSAALHDILAKVVSPQFSADWGPAIAAPTVEETVKTLGIAAIVLVARAQVNSVLDGVVYGAVVGLGFQVVEDIVYAVSAVALAGDGDQVGPVVTTFFLRGFLAGLWSHMLFSAIAGAGIGYLVVRTDRPRWHRLGAAAGGLLAAWSCHFLWNSPLLADGFGYGGWGVLAGLVLKGAPPLVMIYFVVRVARGREGDYYTAQLTALGDPLMATPDEVRVLGNRRLRAAARQHAYRRVGRRGRRAVRHLQRAQAGLAVALSRAAAMAPIWPEHAEHPGSAEQQTAPDERPDGRPEPAEVSRWRDEVLVQRGRLVALGHPYAMAPVAERGTACQWVGRLAGPIAAVLAVAVIWTAIRALGGG